MNLFFLFVKGEVLIWKIMLMVGLFMVRGGNVLISFGEYIVFDINSLLILVI